MARLFSTQFRIDPSVTLDEILDLSKEWVTRSRYLGLKREDIEGIDDHGQMFERKGFSYEVGRLKKEESETIGIRYTNPGKKSGEAWKTEIVANKGKRILPVSVAIDYSAPKVQRSMPSCNKPYIVKMMLTRFGGDRDGDLQVSNQPHFIKEGQGDEAFVADILSGSAKSIMPIVYVSRDRNGLSMVNPIPLADKLSGLAHVLVEPSRDFSFLLRNETNGQNVFDGAVGIYWADGYNRFFWLPDQLAQEDDPIKTINCKVVELLNSRGFPRDLDWQNLQSVANLQRIARMEKEHEKDSEGLLNAYSEELELQAGQLRKAEERIQKLEKELRKATFSKPMANGISPSAQVNPIYEGEVSTIISEAIETAENNTYSGSRRQLILSQVRSSLSSSTEERDRICNKIKTMFRGYERMTNPIRSELESMGFELEKDGKHWKLFRPDNPDLFEMISVTSSDKRRGGQNMAAEIIRRFF